MLNKLRKRVRSEKGFTLIELLVVMIILGILTAIAIPSYLSFKGRAESSAAKSDVRAAIPSAEAYYADYGDYAFTKLQNGTATTSAKAALYSYDAGLATNLKVAPGTGNTTYCISDKEGSKIAKVIGPQGATGSAPLTDATGTTECAGT